MHGRGRASHDAVVRRWWGRTSASRWRKHGLGLGLVLVSAVLLVASLGWAYFALSGGDAELSKAANQGQIFGVVLAALSLVLAAIALVVTWPRDTGGQHTPASPRIMLARRVREEECRVRAALLGGVIAADVAFDRMDGRSLIQTAAGPPGTSPAEAVPSGPPAGGLAQRVWQTAVRLLSWREERSGDTGQVTAEGSLADIGGYYLGLPDRRLVIVGDKGSGKTILAIELVISLAQAVIDNPDADTPVPVRLSAASWTTGRDLAEWLAEQLTLTYGVPRAAAEQLVAGHQILSVLDGLDEMDPDPRTEDDHHDDEAEAPPRAAALITALNSWYAGRDFAPVVVTTRPGRHDQLHRRGLLLDHARTIRIRPLTSTQITGYVGERYRDKPHLRQAWQPIVDALDQPGMVRELLATPLRLMLAITAIEDDPTTAARLALPPPPASGTPVPASAPASRARLESMLIAAFIPAATRLTPRRTRLGIGGGRYHPDQVHRWLTHLARHLDWQARYAAEHRAPRGMSPVDIVPHLLWPIGGWRLPRLLQTATILIALATAAVALFPLSTWADFVHRWWDLITDRQWARAARQVLNVVLGGCGIVCLLFFANRLWPEPAVAGRAKPSLRDRFTRIASGLVVGLALAFLGWLTSQLMGWLAGWLVLGFVNWVAGGLAIGLIVGLMGNLQRWERTADLLSPHRAVHGDFALGLALGIVLALMTVVGFALMLPTAVGSELPLGSVVGFGLPVGFTGGLMVGGAGIRYGFGLFCAALRERLPWRLAAFCQWACDAGLLRVAGAAYQFRHRELQDWLARTGSRSTEPQPQQHPHPLR